jgi:arylformamidase
MKLIDVTVPLDANLPLYPGNAPFVLEPAKRIARGDSSNLSALHLSAHAGTHVDAPRHFYDDGPDIGSGAEIGADQLSGYDLSGTVRVLFRTRNSRLWNSREFHRDYVGVTEAGARYLVDHGVKVVGVDYLSVEQFRAPGAPAHHVLLGAGVIVIEGLNLLDVEPGTYEMLCLPLRIVGSDGAPARVILRAS